MQDHRSRVLQTSKTAVFQRLSACTSDFQPGIDFLTAAQQLRGPICSCKGLEMLRTEGVSGIWGFRTRNARLLASLRFAFTFLSVATLERPIDSSYPKAFHRVFVLFLCRETRAVTDEALSQCECVDFSRTS